MKKVSKLFVLAFILASMTTFIGCKKNADNPPITAPAITTAAVSTITTTSAESGGNVTSTGGAEVIARGVCWSNAAGPTIADSKTTDGAGIGTFSSNIADLTPNTTYYVRAYATNIAGTAYGNEISFTANQIALPSLTTNSVTSIGSTSAVSGGNISADGGDLVAARGICWGTEPNPTISNNKTTNESGTGSFSSYLDGLEPSTTYYVRAYATNSAGTAYGNELSFPTSLVQVGGTQKADFPGGVRYHAAGFSIGTKVYIGLGLNADDGTESDLWEWDQATDLWTKKADYTGNPTEMGVCFSIGTKGYIATAYSNEFWEYDPETNTWTQKAALPGTASRNFAAGFSIGNKGYVGTGTDGTSSLKDFWEWDQETNVWTKKADFGGLARYGAVAFSIGTKGYIGTGVGGELGSILFKDFWEWNQANDTWTKKADFGGSARLYAVGFSIDNKGYLGNGYNGNYPLFKDYWEWDQGSDEWIRKTDFEGDARIWAVGVSIGNKGYIGTGIGGPGFLNDFWEYDPTLN